MAGVGINELFLFLAILLFMCFVRDGINSFRNFFFSHQLTVLAAIFLVVFFFFGYFSGLVYAPDQRAIFQFMRLFIFALFLLPLPFVAARIGVSTPQNDLMVLMLGVTTSALVNWGLFLFGNREDPSLPGQNMIGQSVALFFPFLMNLFFKEKRATRKILILSVVFLFLVTSVYSWSKGSWLGVALGLFFMILFNAKRHFFLAALSVLFLTISIATNYDELMHIYSVEMSASTGSNSNSQRFATFMSGFYIAMDHPFGVGTAYEHVASSYLRETGMYWVQPDPHNTWAHVASQSGFFGLFCFLAINFFAIFSVLSRKTTQDLFKATLITIFIVGTFLMQLSGGFVTQAYWWVILGIMLAARAAAPVKRRAPT